MIGLRILGYERVYPKYGLLYGKYQRTLMFFLL